MLQLLGQRIILQRQSDDARILDEVDPVHFERGAIDESAVDWIDGQLQRVRERLRPQANRMIVVAMDENAVRADPPADPQPRSGKLAGIDKIVVRQVLDQDPRAILRGDLKRAIGAAKPAIEHIAQNLTVHLQAIDQNGVGFALKSRGHRCQRSVIQHRVRNLAAHERVGHAACRKRHIVCAGHEGELAIARIVEGQRTLGVEDFLLPVVRLHLFAVTYLLLGVAHEANRRVVA